MEKKKKKEKKNKNVSPNKNKQKEVKKQKKAPKRSEKVQNKVKKKKEEQKDVQVTKKTKEEKLDAKIDEEIQKELKEETLDISNDDLIEEKPGFKFRTLVFAVIIASLISSIVTAFYINNVKEEKPKAEEVSKNELALYKHSDGTIDNNKENGKVIYKIKVNNKDAKIYEIGMSSNNELKNILYKDGNYKLVEVENDSVTELNDICLGDSCEFKIHNGFDNETYGVLIKDKDTYNYYSLMIKDFLYKNRASNIDFVKENNNAPYIVIHSAIADDLKDQVLENIFVNGDSEVLLNVLTGDIEAKVFDKDPVNSNGYYKLVKLEDGYAKFFVRPSKDKERLMLIDSKGNVITNKEDDSNDRIIWDKKNVYVIRDGMNYEDKNRYVTYTYDGKFIQSSSKRYSNLLRIDNGYVLHYDSDALYISNNNFDKKIYEFEKGNLYEDFLSNLEAMEMKYLKIGENNSDFGIANCLNEGVYVKINLKNTDNPIETKYIYFNPFKSTIKVVENINEI